MKNEESTKSLVKDALVILNTLKGNKNGQENLTQILRDLEQELGRQNNLISDQKRIIDPLIQLGKLELVGDTGTSNDYRDVLSVIQNYLSQLNNQGIETSEVQGVFNSLDKYWDDLSTLESSAGAIRNEISAPLKIEVERFSELRRFSKLGYWIGSIGLVISILTISGLTVFNRDSSVGSFSFWVSSTDVKLKLDSMSQLINALQPTEPTLDYSKVPWYSPHNPLFFIDINFQPTISVRDTVLFGNKGLFEWEEFSIYIKSKDYTRNDLAYLYLNNDPIESESIFTLLRPAEANPFNFVSGKGLHVKEGLRYIFFEKFLFEVVRVKDTCIRRCSTQE